MRYLRNESRDSHYDKLNATMSRMKREVKFTSDPSDYRDAIQYRTVAKAEPVNSKGTCHWCNTVRCLDDFVKVKHRNNFKTFIKYRFFWINDV